MERSYYIGLAEGGLRMPIGTHLVLHEAADVAAIELDGARLGDMVVRAAGRFNTPLAVPLMDLKLEKEALLAARGIAAAEIESFHFSGLPGAAPDFTLTPRMRATCEAIRHVAKHPGLVPMGMGIGPFSLMTKLIGDPITPVFLAGTGVTAAEDPEVALIERVVELGTELLLHYYSAQIDAGAKAIIVCEPAANLVYFSPNQLANGYDIFDRYVTAPMRRIKALFDARGVDLVFHDCGELTTGMIGRFVTLDPAMLSFGCSRLLWEDAALLPKSIVLYGNLPTKRFPASQLSVADVERLARELLDKMHATGHPFILGSECDVLSVPGSEREIMAKVEAFMKC
ncbi:MAG: uroporphyrinogen decarboxylase family protein [Verrucomicrobiota bacterium]